MKLNFCDLDTELYRCVTQLADVLHIELSPDGLPVVTTPLEAGLSVDFQNGRAEIGYHRRVEFFRAVGLLVEHFSDRTAVREIPHYRELSVMYDCSRNAVASVESMKERIRHLALMGYTSVLLYTEDTYEIEEYPYFGYMRGRYTQAELRELDDYAYQFGIELIPCIQVLAHLSHALRWRAHRGMLDCDDILLVDEPKTYAFIEAMLDACCRCFRTRRINIGMDEAWNLGNGEYFRRNGYQEHTDILRLHLSKVMEMINARQLRPMMWSDMLFSAAFERNYYYYATTLDDPHIPQSVVDMIPQNMELVYWDYGHVGDGKGFRTMLRMHGEMNRPTWFAGGATMWAGYAPMNGFSILAARKALAICREFGVDQIMVTTWQGHEASEQSILPTLQVYAEDCYADQNSDEFVAKRFATCVDGEYEDFLLLDTPNFVPDNPSPGCGSRDPSKYLFHQDVMLGLFDRHQSAGYAAHFAERAEVLRTAADRNPRWRYLFDTLAALCYADTLKADVGVRLKAAYDNGDKQTMALIANEELPEIQRRIMLFGDAFERQWMRDNKVIGFESMDIHIAALARRVSSAAQRVQEYLSAKAVSLPELEQERLYYNGDHTPGQNPNMTSPAWSKMVSASTLDPI